MTVAQRTRKLGHRLAGAVRPQAIVLLYHRVTELDDDPWSLAVRPSHFAEHLDVLRRRAAPLSLGDLVAHVREGRDLPRSAVAVTFDDGYADNLAHALPALEHAGVPATVFVATGGLETEQPFWWDELETLVLHTEAGPAELRVTIKGTEYRWTLSEAALDTACLGDVTDIPRRPIFHDLWVHLRGLAAAEQHHVLSQLRHAFGVSTGTSEVERLGLSGVTALAASGLVEVGAHTVSHPSLGTLPVEQQRAEILASKARLEELTEAPVRSFAYPFGKRADYTPHTARIVREAGYESACTNVPAPVTRATDLYALPRIYVEDQSGEQFERTIGSWLPLR